LRDMLSWYSSRGCWAEQFDRDEPPTFL
jgi:hypothetical protein